MRSLQSCILWQTVLCSIVLTTTPTSWSQIRISNRLRRMDCKLESFSPEYLLEGTSCRRLENSNLQLQVDTSATWTGVYSGTMIGLQRPTQGEFYRQLEHHQHRHANNLYTSESDYTTQHGYDTSGEMRKGLHMWTYIAWTSSD